MKSAIALSLLAGTEAAETVLGAYIFHRHGDRTPKALAPTNLTTLGYEQVYASGQYYRSRYLNSSSTAIQGINTDIVKLSQLSVTAPVDNVLQNSAMGFLQGLYPPVQTVQVLASGDSVQAPMDGYQLIPVNTIQTGAGSEDAGWLQDASSCPKAKSSSNAYFESQEYRDLLDDTKDLYAGVVDAVNGTLSADQVSYKNAYIVYDVLNVASIHNSSFSSLLPTSTLSNLSSLASIHEYALAYNASSTVRAIAGMQLAGEILSNLNSTISTKGKKQTLAIQFGAYATFLSFFGLSGLAEQNNDFTKVVDYASSMAFELFVDTSVAEGEWPEEKDLKVRFLFHNGVASSSSPPTVYPLSNSPSSSTSLSWKDFSAKLSAFAITSTEQWCTTCGTSEGTCAAFASPSSTSSSSNNKNSGSGGAVSPAVGGVIGACVTLVVVLGALAAAMVLGGFRIAKKSANRGAAVEGVQEEKAKA